MSLPLREKAAAKCQTKSRGDVFKRQARKARAENLVKCILEPGKKKAKNKPLTVLCVQNHFTEDRAKETSKAL